MVTLALLREQHALQVIKPNAGHNESGTMNFVDQDDGEDLMGIANSQLEKKLHHVWF